MNSLNSFDDSFSFEKSVNILSRLCHHLLPPHHPFIGMVSRKEWGALAKASVNYSDHLDASTVKAERQVLAFFQKNADLPLGIDRKKVAYEKFVSAERDCRVTNWRIRNRRFDPARGFDAAFLFEMQCEIASILGPAPSLDELNFGFGPGANVGTLKRLTSARHKMSVKPTYSTNASELVEYLTGEFPHWDFLQKSQETDYGKLSFVPKDAKTDRSIETQPMINGFVQLGLGKYIKGRLLKFGCDLRRGQPWNAELARRGSLTDGYATIDLASASDTIASMLVLELFPPEWFHLLDAVRVPNVLYRKKLIPLEKFSGMGNGSTFEVESLLFYAVCRVVARRSPEYSQLSEHDNRYHVYGDDIIVPTCIATEVVSRLEGMGFTINLAKSYLSGRFRESCGKDFFDGVDVRPVYVKKNLSYQTLFTMHNFFFRRGQAYMADICLKFIPGRLKRITGPDGYGDGHLLSLTPKMRPHGRTKGWSGWTFDTYKAKARTVKTGSRGDYPAFLYLSSVKPRSSWWEPSTRVRDTMYNERGTEGYNLSRIYTLRNCTFPA